MFCPSYFLLIISCICVVKCVINNHLIKHIYYCYPGCNKLATSKSVKITETICANFSRRGCRITGKWRMAAWDKLDCSRIELVIGIFTGRSYNNISSQIISRKTKQKSVVEYYWQIAMKSRIS